MLKVWLSIPFQIASHFRRPRETPFARVFPEYRPGKPLFLALLLLQLANPAVGGPNEDGMLVVHIADGVTITRAPDVCRDPGIRDGCLALTGKNVADDGELVVLYILAAFPTRPELMAVNFGIAYDTYEPEDWGACGDFELTSPNWPSAWEGIAVAFNSVQTDRIVPLTWFAMYAYQYNYFEIVDHPTQGIQFGDGSVPSVLDDLRSDQVGYVEFGGLGFNPACAGQIPGGCCSADGSCIVTIESACDAEEGVFLGEEQACNPQSCNGVCCLDNDCFELSASECQLDGGEFQGPGTRCGFVSCVRLDTTWGQLKSRYRGY